MSIMRSGEDKLTTQIRAEVKSRPQQLPPINADTYEPTKDEAEAMLTAVRKRADGWRSGLAATVALVLASLAIKPGDGFMRYTGDTRTQLMLLLGGSIVSALAGLLFLVKAANGPTWLTDLVGPTATPRRYIARAAGARSDLRRGQFVWMFSLVLFCTAVAVTWFAALPPSAG